MLDGPDRVSETRERKIYADRYYEYYWFLQKTDIYSNIYFLDDIFNFETDVINIAGLL